MSKLTWFYKYYIILQFCLGLTYAIDCSMDAILSSSEQKASIFLSGANSAAHLGLVYIFPWEETHPASSLWEEHERLFSNSSW